MYVFFAFAFCLTSAENTRRKPISIELLQFVSGLRAIMELPWERHFVWLKTSRKCHRNASEYAVP